MALVASTLTFLGPLAPPADASGAVTAHPSFDCAALVVPEAGTGGTHPGTATAQVGTVRATLSGVQARDTYGVGPGLAHPGVTIWVKNKQVYSAGVRLALGGKLQPGQVIEPSGLDGFTASQPLCVIDFTGASHGAPGETAVMLGMYSGGAHCCTWVDTYVLRPGGKVLGPFQDDLGNAPGGLLQLAPGGAILVSRDNAFYYEFDAYAVSGAPLLVLVPEGRRLVNVTRHYPTLIAQDAKTWWSAYQQVQSPNNEGPGGGLGLLAAWVADECLLGNQRAAWATVDKLSAEHRLSGGRDHDDAFWPSGAKYVKQLRKFLSHLHYC